MDIKRGEFMCENLNIKMAILDLRSEYEEKNGEKPTNIYFTYKEEKLLSRLGIKELGSKIIGNISVNGIRKTFLKTGIFEMKCHWDSKEFKVD
jgi:hypothetical protein